MCVVVSRAAKSAVERRPAFLIVQVDEFLEEAKKNVLFLFVQGSKQAAAQHVRTWDKLLHKRGSLRRELKQSMALAFHRHHPPHETTLFQPHRQICGCGGIEGAQPRKCDLVNAGMILKNA
jgi:hypothetical protein